ncbi:MAG: hypothetical protein AAF443_00255 [Chlamydiota bacterium]
MPTKPQAPKFYSRALFRYCERVKLSYQQAADKQRISRRTAINRISRDIESGYIEKQKTHYKHPCHRALLYGKNIYLLTNKGKSCLSPVTRPGPSPKNLSDCVTQNSSSSQLVSDAVYTLFSSSKEEKSQAFSKLLECCPHWWTENLATLKKTLRLLRQKISKGYRVRSIPCWISSVLKQSGVGFSRRQAAKLSSQISSKPPSPTASNPSSSPYQQEASANLGALAKQGLNTSPKALLPLLRKGNVHLNLAVKALLIIGKKKPIKNPNAFLNWLVSLKNPMDLFKPRFRSNCPCDWAKTKLAEIKDRCVFLKACEKPEKNDVNKTYVYFAVHRTDPTRSFLQIYWFERGLYSLWQETFLSLSDPEFYQKFSEIFFKKGAPYGSQETSTSSQKKYAEKKSVLEPDAA